ncbi:unknown [Prevotella sp. CAG:1124]|nr:unknown [Prevotella sp. CAG:1124]
MNMSNLQSALRLKSPVRLKTAKHNAKGRLSTCKRPSFRAQKTAFCNALATNMLRKGMLNGRYNAK